jgi:hypothetical protein
MADLLDHTNDYGSTTLSVVVNNLDVCLGPRNTILWELIKLYIAEATSRYEDLQPPSQKSNERHWRRTERDQSSNTYNL